MIDGGGLAWKWTREWVPASESRRPVSACEWPAGRQWPGRARQLKGSGVQRPSGAQAW